MGERQRLGVQDALWLEMDEPGNLMVVDSLLWTEEPIDWNAFRATMQERLWDRFPVFRSVVVRGEDGGWCWEEQAGAEVEDRYLQVVLPEPGGDAELQDLIASQRTVPLDRSEPLWRAVLVDGFHGGSAVLFRAHHAIADGIRMVQLVLSVLDAGPGETGAAQEPGSLTASAPPLGASPDPDHGSSADRASSRTAGAAALWWQLAQGSLTNPVGVAHTVLSRSGALLGAAGRISRPRLPPVLAGVAGDADTVRKLLLGTRNDTTAWTGTVGDDKAVAWSPSVPLDEVKAVARAHAATVNDVLVTCVAESLRAYLESHRAACRSVAWDVPVNLKPFDATLPVVLGNSFALVQLELPTDIDDPARTLEVVRRRMGRIKRGHEAVVDFAVQAAVSRMSKRLYRATIDLIANRAVGVLTNVPGPQVPLYLAGQQVVGMMGWAPLTADQVMSVTIFSYDGTVFVGIAADTGLVPDHREVVDGFADAFRRLALLTATTAGAGA